MSRDIRTHKGRSLMYHQWKQGEVDYFSNHHVKAPVRKYIGRCDCEWCHSNRTYSSQKAQLVADMSRQEWEEGDEWPDSRST